MQALCIISLISAFISAVATVVIQSFRKDIRKTDENQKNPNVDITIDM
jgi:hypothetical protein